MPWVYLLGALGSQGRSREGCLSFHTRVGERVLQSTGRLGLRPHSYGMGMRDGAAAPVPDCRQCGRQVPAPVPGLYGVEVRSPFQSWCGKELAGVGSLYQSRVCTELRSGPYPSPSVARSWLGSGLCPSSSVARSWSPVPCPSPGIIRSWGRVPVPGSGLLPGSGLHGAGVQFPAPVPGLHRSRGDLPATREPSARDVPRGAASREQEPEADQCPGPRTAHAVVPAAAAVAQSRFRAEQGGGARLRPPLAPRPRQPGSRPRPRQDALQVPTCATDRETKALAAVPPSCQDPNPPLLSNHARRNPALTSLRNRVPETCRIRPSTQQRLPELCVPLSRASHPVYPALTEAFHHSMLVGQSCPSYK